MKKLSILIIIFSLFLINVESAENTKLSDSYNFEIVKNKWYGTFIEHEPKISEDFYLFNLIKIPIIYDGIDFSLLLIIIFFSIVLIIILSCMYLIYFVMLEKNKKV